MQLIIYHPAAGGVWAGALFASVLQCSGSCGSRRVVASPSAPAQQSLPRQATPSVASVPRWPLAG
jgi:hypothetical protein